MSRCLLLVVLAFSLSAQGAPPSKWCLLQAEDESGDLVFITVNLGFQKFPRKADYPWLLELNVATLHQNKNGHPTDEEAPVLNGLEEQLTAALSTVTDLQFIGRATTRGHRELLYYLKDAEKADRLLAQLSKSRQPRAWEYRISKDVRWRRLGELTGPKPECL